METNLSALPKALSSTAQFDLLTFFRIAQNNTYVSGRLDLSSMTRLAIDLPQQSGGCEWRLSIFPNTMQKKLVSLSVKAVVQVVCQRCMSDFSLPITSMSTIEVLRSEDQYEVSGDLCDNELVLEAERYEQVVGSASFDLAELIEDELILAIPYVPKHDICPSLPKKSILNIKEEQNNTETEKKSPFSVLAQLKSTD